MQRLRHTLIASTILLSFSASWAADREMMNQPRSAPPPPEVLPIPIPEPPRYQPAPRNDPIPMPEPRAPREMNRRPPPEAIPITLP